MGWVWLIYTFRAATLLLIGKTNIAIEVLWMSVPIHKYPGFSPAKSPIVYLEPQSPGGNR